MNNTTEDKILMNAKLKLDRILNKADKMGYIGQFDGKDYPEYIHNLWSAITNQPMLMQEALAVEQKLGNGDTIQLVSDAMVESFYRHLENY
ncbi:MAG: hypothetical protein WA951_00525 [Leeuwenhoekiella sp.]